VRIFLTGGTGFVGSHAARALLSEGTHDVALLIRPEANAWRIAELLPHVQVIAGDLRQPNAWASPLRRFRPEAVVHLAWSGVLNRARNEPQQDDNIRSVVDCVRLAHSAGARHWIGLGSQAEYGPCGERIDETTPTRPTTRYGQAKLAACRQAEQLCRSLGLRFAWLRLFSCYGPQDDPSWMIPYVARALLRGERPAVTAGEQCWDYLYVSDAAEAIRRTTLTPGAEGIFNLASGRPQTVRRIIEWIRDRIDPGLVVGFGEVEYRPDQVMRMEASIDRLRRAAAWEPTVDLQAGLANTVAWCRDQVAREGFVTSDCQ
jgi:nucleoside-diphosphate-sugar epimerase